MGIRSAGEVKGESPKYLYCLSQENWLAGEFCQRKLKGGVSRILLKNKIYTYTKVMATLTQRTQMHIKAGSGTAAHPL